jgi:sporulation protein YlmC with PRC-barrel domain
MRASDLIGLDVVDADGTSLGIVTDLRCVQDGPLRGAMQAPRVSALLVSRRHTGSLLGYDRRAQQGPWLIRAIVQFLHRDAVFVPWDSVAGFDGRITLKHGPTGIETLPK